MSKGYRLTDNLNEIILGDEGIPMLSQSSFCSSTILQLAEGPFIPNPVVAGVGKERGLTMSVAG